MNLTTIRATIKGATLALAAITTLSLAACGSSGGFSLTPGDYQGAAVGNVDGDTPIFIYLTLTLAENGSVTGSGEMYDAGAFTASASLPEGFESFAVTGQASGDGLDLDFENNVTGAGVQREDGSVAFVFGGDTGDGIVEGIGLLAEPRDGEIGVACGEFAFSESVSVVTHDTEGFVMLVGGADGGFFGALLSDEFAGITEGVFTVGCAAETCGGSALGYVEGDYDGDDIELDFTETGYVNFSEGDTTFFGLYNVGLTSSDFTGMLEADTSYCLNGDYD